MLEDSVQSTLFIVLEDC